MTVPVPPVKLTVDGLSVEAPAGTYVLEVARRAGIDIPTLCDHPALEPIGECKLCAVEVTHPGWHGRSDVVMACLFPVAEGIRVSTRSPRVLETRRLVLASLLERAPGAPELRRLAARHGVALEGESEAPTAPTAAERCVACSLCARVCQAHAILACADPARGPAKTFGPICDEPPLDCIGCGGCADLCPTGRIEAHRTATGYEIWGRSFESDPCAVETTRCLGCGTCEELCPFSVARVALGPQGERIARIPAEHCRGCGVCVAACPAGAIVQRGAGNGWSALVDSPQQAGPPARPAIGGRP